MSKNDTKYIDKYNEHEYARYTIRIRKDTQLYENIEELKKRKNFSLNYLIANLLKKHFQIMDWDTDE